jgi:hypothetical protein
VIRRLPGLPESLLISGRVGLLPTGDPFLKYRGVANEGGERSILQPEKFYYSPRQFVNEIKYLSHCATIPVLTTAMQHEIYYLIACSGALQHETQHTAKALIRYESTAANTA